MEVEDMCTPETYTCNGSGSRKTCKHQSKREQLEREKELLRRQEENPNQEEEAQDSGMEGEGTSTPREWRLVVTENEDWERTKYGNTLRTSGGQAG